MSEIREYDFSRAERGRHARRRKVAPGEIVRLWIIVKLDWEGEPPAWPSSNTLLAESGNVGFMLRKRDEEIAVLDVSHADYAAKLLGDKLALGQTLPIQHEDHHRAKAHIRGIHRLVATGNGDYTSHIELATTANLKADTLTWFTTPVDRLLSA